MNPYVELHENSALLTGHLSSILTFEKIYLCIPP
jgi:hypothetical protein